MFAYLRYFSIASFVIVLAAAYLAGNHFRNLAAEDLRVVVEQNNNTLAQGYMNTIWRNKYYRKMFEEELANIPPGKWVENKRYLTFVRNTFRYFEGVPLIKLYTPEQELFLTNDSSQAAASAGMVAAPEAMPSLRQGKAHSNILEDSVFKSPDGSLTSGTLIQTIVPILSDNYVPVVAGSDIEIEGYAELYVDITPQWRQLDDFQMKGTAGIIGIFLLLFALLMFTAKRAETIIARQHDKNQELVDAKTRAESENRDKSRFLANISHELRTPLNAIIGFSEIIKSQSMGPLGNPQYEEYISDIHSSGVHLLSLINDILDYSKAEAGKLELETSELDAVKILKNCMRLVSTRAEEANVNLVEELPKEHFAISTDPKKLKQILLNLLSNAVKFTPEQGSVTLAAWRNMADESVTIQVKDTGIGIAPKDISRAMAPFGQVDSDLSRKYEGTGLGLPLTKKLTEVMGGSFTIQSELQKGTTVTIVLPREAPEQNVKKGPNVKAQQAEEEDEGSGFEPVAAGAPAAGANMAASEGVAPVEQASTDLQAGDAGGVEDLLAHQQDTLPPAGPMIHDAPVIAPVPEPAQMGGPATPESNMPAMETAPPSAPASPFDTPIGAEQSAPPMDVTSAAPVPPGSVSLFDAPPADAPAPTLSAPPSAPDEGLSTSEWGNAPLNAMDTMPPSALAPVPFTENTNMQPEITQAQDPASSLFAPAPEAPASWETTPSAADTLPGAGALFQNAAIEEPPVLAPETSAAPLDDMPPAVEPPQSMQNMFTGEDNPAPAEIPTEPVPLAASTAPLFGGGAIAPTPPAPLPEYVPEVAPSDETSPHNESQSEADSTEDNQEDSSNNGGALFNGGHADAPDNGLNGNGSLPPPGQVTGGTVIGGSSHSSDHGIESHHPASSALGLDIDQPAELPASHGSMHIPLIPDKPADNQSS